MKLYRLAAVLAVLTSLQSLPALAVVVHGRVWEATYVAAYQPTFGPQKVSLLGHHEAEVQSRHRERHVRLRARSAPIRSTAERLR